MSNSMRWWLMAFGAVIILIIGVIVFQSGGNGDSGGSDTFASGQQLPKDSSGETEQTPSNSDVSLENYVQYSDTAVADAAGTKRVVFFHASWCPTCNAFQADINENGVPADITIIQADFDDDVDLKREYGVTVQSTFVLLDDAGNVEMRWPFGQGLSGITDLYEQVSSS